MAKMCIKRPLGPNGLLIKVVENQTLDEYMKIYGDDYKEGRVWDFSLEDVQSGAIEIDSNQVYWFIENRLYETC